MKKKYTRNEIISASQILFNKKGYNKTSVNDILEAVGASKGGFYHHFRSKEGVMDEIIDLYIEKGVGVSQEIAADTSLTVHEKFCRILHAQNLNNIKKDNTVDILRGPENAQMRQKSFVEIILKLSPILTQVVVEGISQGIFETEYPQETMEIFTSSVVFLFDDSNFPWSRAQLVHKVKAIVYVLEVALHAEKGSMSYLHDLLETS